MMMTPKQPAEAADIGVSEAYVMNFRQFLLRPMTLLRILWVAVRLAAALLLLNRAHPFFYQGF